MSERRLLRLTAITGLVWLLAGIPAGSSAQSASGLGGFQIGTTGSAVSMTYMDPNSPIPASPTGEMHAAYTLAQTETGPSGHGVAAELWPGETASTAAPFIEQTFWQEFEGGFEDNDQEPPFTNPNVVPRWPLAAEAFEPQGPNEQAVAPNAQTTAQGEYAYSEANTTPLQVPGVFNVEGGFSSSLAETGDIELDDGRKVPGAISHVKAVATDITLLGGFVSIEKVTTTARATSDGERARLAGRTVVSGLQIAGQGYTIDHEGIHADGETNDGLNPILGQLREAGETALSDQGISITLAQAVDTVSGARGSRNLGGLIVRLDSRRFDDLVTQLPEELQREIRGRSSTDHTLTLVFGSVTASASAALEVAFDAGSFDFGDDLSVPPRVLSQDTLAPTPVEGSAPAPSTPPDPSGGTISGAQPTFAAPVEVDGIGAGVALMAIALVLAAARGLHWMSGALLAGGAADDCRN